MNEENETEWTKEERALLDGLPREMVPPSEVEGRIVAALAARGAFGGSRKVLPGPWLWLLAAAAAAALFAAGLSVGRGEAKTPARIAGPRFILFLFDEGERGGGNRVAEYKAWATRIRAGRYVTGQKLKPGGRWLTASAGSAESDKSESESLGGYFVIEAADLAGALEVARTCPHLRHGGRILVRAVDPV
ncbi:MAG: YciI family protein [Acidobacteriota bacterium]